MTCIPMVCIAIESCRPSSSKQQLDVLHVDAGIDYRRRAMARINVFVTLGRGR